MSSSIDRSTVNDFWAVRPAFNLDLSSVVFTSAAEDRKSSITEGVLYEPAPLGTGAIKFTMRNDSMSKPRLTLEGGNETDTLTFSYTGAEPGQYISCVLNDGGELKYYGKLAQTDGVADGNFSISVDDVADGEYALEIFFEELNGDKSTDFCGAPVSGTLTVSTEGIATVSGFSVPVEKPDGNSNENSNENSGGGTCNAVNTGWAAWLLLPAFLIKRGR